MSNQAKPDFSDVPTTTPNGMWDVGTEGQTPADMVGIILGNKDFKDDPELQVLLRTNFTPQECTIVMRILIRAKYGLGLVERKGADWAMPWLKHAVVFLASSRSSEGFHSINKAVEALTAMRPKTEQTIKMSQI